MGATFNFEPQPGVYFTSNVTLTPDGNGGYVVSPGNSSGSQSQQVFAQQTDVSVTTASTQLAPAVGSAHMVTIAHPGGTNTVFVAVGKAATLNSGTPIYPGGSWTSDSITGQVNGIVSTGTENVTPYY